MGDRGNEKKGVIPHESALQGGQRWAVEAASSHCHCRPDNGSSDWPKDGESGLMPDRDAKLGTATGLGSQSVLVVFRRCAMEVRNKGYMNHRHGLIGLQTLTNIVFAMALILSQPSWAATSSVTIGGPFTLT